MNRRIKKKLKKRFGIRHYKKYKEYFPIIFDYQEEFFDLLKKHCSEPRSLFSPFDFDGDLISRYVFKEDGSICLLDYPKTYPQENIFGEYANKTVSKEEFKESVVSIGGSKPDWSLFDEGGDIK